MRKITIKEKLVEGGSYDQKMRTIAVYNSNSGSEHYDITMKISEAILAQGKKVLCVDYAKSHISLDFEPPDEHYDFKMLIMAEGAQETANELTETVHEKIIVVSEDTDISKSYEFIKLLAFNRSKHRIKLVVNKSRAEESAIEIYCKLGGVAGRFLNIAIDYLGHIIMPEYNLQPHGEEKTQIISDRSRIEDCFAIIARRLVENKALEVSLSCICPTPLDSKTWEIINKQLDVMRQKRKAF